MGASGTPSHARPCFPWEYGADTYVRMLSCARSVSFDSSSAQAMDQVIQRCLDGDQSAWETIVRTHWRRVFNIAYKFVGRHDEAEDLAQDVFLKLFKSLGTFDRRANFSTWLISVSRNLCIDHYRSTRREHDMVRHDVDVVGLPQPSTSESCLLYTSPSPRDRQK